MSAIRNLPPHAMAKNESTAVNDLINLVSTQVPRKPAPDEDLMFAEPAKRKVEAKPPRMTGTVPAMRGAGAVEPLPAGRGATGTSQLRITTAPPSRQTTIPPIASAPAIPPPRTASSPALPVPRVTTTAAAITPPVTSAPELALPVRPTRPSLPPPTRTSAPARTTAPASMPVAAPFEANPYAAPSVAHAPIDLTDQSWFEESRAGDRVTAPVHEDTWVGTVQVPRQASTAHWLRKLAPAMGGMIVLGMFVGGFIAFDGEGGHKRASQPTPPVAVAAAPVTAPAAVIAPVAPPPSITAPTAAPTAVAVAAPEPVAAPATEPAAAPTPAPAAAAATEPAPVTPPNLAAISPAAAAAPAIAAPAVANGRPVFVDVRIDTQPEGATVMLVDRGKTTFLGSTPISTAVDPARTYDLVFTYANRPTQVEHLDPRTTSKLAVTLGRPGNTVKPATGELAKAAPAPVAAPAIKAEPKPKAEAARKAEKAKVETAEPKAEKAKVEAAEPKAEKAKAETAEPKAAKAKLEATEPKAEKAIAAPAPKAEKPTAVASGQGVLMISSKPPCEIYVDGKATGLTTPQRALAMPVGAHKITLVNKTEKITKTLSVQITAEKPTKVIQDLMK